MVQQADSPSDTLVEVGALALPQLMIEIAKVAAVRLVCALWRRCGFFLAIFDYPGP